MSANSLLEMEETEEDLLGPPKPPYGGKAEECIPNRQGAPPLHPEDELIKFVSQVRAAECVQDWPMRIYSAITYSPFTPRLPFQFMRQIFRVFRVR